MYEKEWIPNVLAMGISYNDFWDMNPRIVKVYIEGYKNKINRDLEYDNYISYLSGIYVRDALASTVGNMFSKKGSKPIEYPKEPYPVTQEQIKDKDERDKEAQRQVFWASLQAMQTNFELSHKGGNGS